MMLPRAFLDTARALVRADTSPGHGTRAAAELLAPLYEAAGLQIRRQEGEPGEVNVLAGRPDVADGEPQAVVIAQHGV